LDLRDTPRADMGQLWEQLWAALFRQSGLTQTLRISHTVIRSSEWRHSVPKIGKPKAGIQFPESCHGFLCSRSPPGQRMTRRRRAHGGREGRLISQGSLLPNGGVVIAASTEMSERHIVAPGEHARVERAQAHGDRRVLDRGIRFAKAD